MKNRKPEDSSSYSPIKVFLRLLMESKKYLFLYALVIVLTIILSSVSVIEADGLKKMINGISQNSRDMLKWGIIQIFAAILLIAPFIKSIKSAIGAKLTTYSSKNMQAKVVNHIMHLDLTKLHELHSADIASRAIDDCSEAQSGVNDTTINLIYNIFRVLFAVFYLSFTSLKLTVGVIAIVVFVPFFVRPLAKGVRDAKDNEKKLMAEINGFILDSYQGSEIIRTYNLSDRLQNLYLDTYEKLISWSKRSLIVAHISNWGLSLTDTITFLFVLIYGGFMVIGGELILGDVVAFIPLLDVIAYPMGRISKMWIDLQEALASGNRVYDLMDLPEEQEADDGVGFIPGDIEFNDVEFSYKQGIEVLKGVTFTAKQGKTTAIVGRSGSGKTTIINLLLKFYTPSAGNIVCGGRDIFKVSNLRWRTKSAYVSQEPGIFTGTVMENILMGNMNATEEHVIDAAKKANIHNFIVTLPRGYQTDIGELGANISGGERQRIAIARAILKDPQILILDEPTSSLDSENERAVQMSLDELMKGKTTIVIAHRLSTIKNADKIVLIEDGLIVGEGTHTELMEENNIYSELYKITEGQAV